LAAKIFEAYKKFKPDALLCSTTVVAESISIAQRYNIPCFLFSTFPFIPTKEIAPVLSTTKPFSFGIFQQKRINLHLLEF